MREGSSIFPFRHYGASLINTQKSVEQRTQPKKKSRFEVRAGAK